MDIAERFLVYDIENGAISRKEECPLVPDQPFQLVSLLRERGVKTIICGGCPQFLLRMLFSNGLEVLPGLSGDPEDVVHMLVDGSLNHIPPYTPFGRRCRNRGRGDSGRNRKKMKEV